MRVNLFGHQGVGPDIRGVPKTGIGVGQIVGRRVNRAILRAHHAPAPLGLHGAQVRQHPRPQPSKAGAMGHLIEAVFRRDRPDPDRLEENVVARIATYRGWPPAPSMRYAAQVLDDLGIGKWLGNMPARKLRQSCLASSRWKTSG